MAPKRNSMAVAAVVGSAVAAPAFVSNLPVARMSSRVPVADASSTAVDATNVFTSVAAVGASASLAGALSAFVMCRSKQSKVSRNVFDPAKQI
eukprot:5261773-Amphidinium_carterae.1